MLKPDGGVVEGARAGTPIDGATGRLTDGSSGGLIDGAAETVDVFELAAAGMVITDRDGHIRRLNPAFAQLLGCRPEDLAGASLGTLTHPDDLDHSKELLGSLQSGVIDTARFENRYLCPDGSAVWVDVSARALRAADGQLTGFLAQVLDITERKGLDEKLAQAAEDSQRLAILARVAPYAVLIADPQGRIQWVNDGFATLGGCRPEKVIGKSGRDLASGPDVDSGEFWRFMSSAQRGEPVGGEFCLAAKDGHLYWADVQVRAVVEDGQVRNLIAVIQDITQRRRAQDRLHGARARAEELARALKLETELLSSVISAVPQLVFWKDARRRYCDANTAYLNFRGYHKADELRGRDEATLDPVSGFAEILDELEQGVLESGEPVLDRHVTLPDSAGHKRVLLLSVLPLGRGMEGGQGIVGVAADVTLVQEMERQLAQANRLESIGQLAAGIAHEINTPVQYIASNTAFLADATTGLLKAARQIEALSRDLGPGGPDCEQGHRALAEVIDQLDLEFLAEDVPSALSESQEGLTCLTRIVRAMKDYSHPGSELADTDINKAIESTVQLCRNEWKYVATVGFDLDPDAGLVPCYAGELKQVILNIVVNAAQALTEQREGDGDRGLGLIKLSSRREADRMVITISDDGPGMPEPVRRRVFEPFFTTKDVGKGTGQGLSLARAVVVDKHGGQLDVASAPDEGARFTISLPLQLKSPEQGL